MKTRNIIITIRGEQAAELRGLWKMMKERGLIAPGERMHSAIYGHLLNLVLRWGDAVNASDGLIMKQRFDEDENS